MNAGELLVASGLDRPEIRVRLQPVWPESIPVKVFPHWVDILLPTWIEAMTTPSAIWVRARSLALGGKRLGRLILHELVHARQWREHGVIGFLRHYLSDYLRARIRGRQKHRAAYRSISLEAEAYGICASFLPDSRGRGDTTG